MPNRLAQETSPYLQQHAGNPVDWYPWGEEALDLARRQDKPILLSIGYSACHWCHVMVHESFEDPEVAALMNRLYVNIKVDREERPDLDQIYQLAHQMLTQRAGGWPLTMFLAPSGEPFFGGTYFPKQPRYGLSGFPDLLQRVAAVYHERRAEIGEQNRTLVAALARTGPEGGERADPLTETPLAEAMLLLEEQFDARFGGFGQAPKFPHAPDLELLLERFEATGTPRWRDMALLTLRRMAHGGIYDQLGGGFCRYSVDVHWNIPHFEKMLYDNGPLLRLYAEAARLTGESLFRRVTEETAQWVMREMQSPEGGYYSSLDADSEGQEGKFYIWSCDEVKTLLAPEEFEIVERHYGLGRPANFEGHAWHLYVESSLEKVAQMLGQPEQECRARLDSARAKLLAARERRVRPGRDEKILTSWNALMIEGMARAGWLLQRPDWVDSAQRAADFIRARLWREGRLLATYKDGRAHLNAYLDDHAFLLKALLTLIEARFRSEDLAFAQQLAQALLARFEDSDAGGFFFTSHDHERLIHRAKPGHDNATPAGNGVAAFALQRMGHLLGEARYLDAAERTLKLFQPQYERAPGGFSTLQLALSEYLGPPRMVVLRGPAAEVTDWHRRSATACAGAHAMILALPPDAARLPGILDKPVGTAVSAWVCSAAKCLPPIVQFPYLERVCKEAEFD